jgi:hypothetical protein
MRNCNFIISAIAIILVIVVLNPYIANADIQAYDYNYKYLGIFMELEDRTIGTFIPSLGALLIIYPEKNPGMECGDRFDPVFESYDCSGTPYSSGPFPLINDFSPTPRGGGFYKTDYIGKKTFTPGSHYNSFCECQQISWYPTAEYYPMVEVQLPFPTPIAFPLNFKAR